ncbi:MAG: enoyl-CoA hydratase/isomerase family protein [Aestuariivirga sp.]|uniref:enoyl-CoA hydratase n=1 Tax=Aestuariivirga sp. TaxID=2650926 RepID=UPI0025B846BC|nr:enoyl-CoA hydratase [Aestuariivirga sp.]MCA3560583.1 enoyl-CoA hydratase/isomerase family protein [Aestuariivirga sp.]
MTPLPSPSPLVQSFIYGSTGWIVLNRAERRNSLNAEMWAAIPPLMKLLDEHADVRSIVIRGAGAEAFASGADISEFGEARNDAAAAARYEQLNGEAFAAIRGASKPVIARIQGYCIGGGLAIALACDLRVADGSAVFGLPPARLGLAYPLDGLRDLAAAIGPSAAKEMIYTARRLTAQDALRIGLIGRVAQDIDAEIEALCAEIAEGAPLTITHAKRALDHVTGRPGHGDEAEIARLSQRCFDSADYIEGRKAFAEKRKPRFLGA